MMNCSMGGVRRTRYSPWGRSFAPRQPAEVKRTLGFLNFGIYYWAGIFFLSPLLKKKKNNKNDTPTSHPIPELKSL